MALQKEAHLYKLQLTLFSIIKREQNETSN